MDISDIGHPNFVRLSSHEISIQNIRMVDGETCSLGLPKLATFSRRQIEFAHGVLNCPSSNSEPLPL